MLKDFVVPKVFALPSHRSISEYDGALCAVCSPQATRFRALSDGCFAADREGRLARRAVPLTQVEY